MRIKQFPSDPYMSQSSCIKWKTVMFLQSNVLWIKSFKTKSTQRCNVCYLLTSWCILVTYSSTYSSRSGRFCSWLKSIACMLHSWIAVDLMWLFIYFISPLSTRSSNNLLIYSLIKNKPDNEKVFKMYWKWFSGTNYCFPFSFSKTYGYLCLYLCNLKVSSKI